MSSINWSKVDSMLADAVASPQMSASDLARGKAVFPGAVLQVGLSGESVFRKAYGSRSILPSLSPMTENTVFDVSSLTKPIITTALCMYLVQRGMLDVDHKLSRVFQTFSVHGKERISIRHLLNHSSGYPGYAPFFKRIAKADTNSRIGFMGTRKAAESVYEEIFRLRLDHLPGKVATYSDIGFILLGHVVETLSGMPLDRLAMREVLGPLGMHSSGFIDLSAVKRKVLVPDYEGIAPTNDCNWRRRLICGEVQDENAWAMGGIAGHAGLFSTIDDVHRFATEMLACYKGGGNFIGQALLKEFWRRDEDTPGSTWALGWDTPTKGASQSGKYFSKNAVGHLGYTGCSMWLDPERELSVCLLSNRVHPSIENNAIKTFRPILHDAIMETLGFV